LGSATTQGKISLAFERIHDDINPVGLRKQR
jgi:hypothetical protein